ncbi:hypothetical protein J4G33_16445 [Actinotalea sp. BY-33]|uniref:Transmembrane protein n=1 Tax=Actinotalea soli TaxID=2819234 RepID=A0A939RWF9_9CELL|nr:hypothetical protein [Actinotalea soli]MBO1753400.1 hypothetical protein [Actinotalea soli]
MDRTAQVASPLPPATMLLVSLLAWFVALLLLGVAIAAGLAAGPSEQPTFLVVAGVSGVSAVLVAVVAAVLPRPDATRRVELAGRSALVVAMVGAAVAVVVAAGSDGSGRFSIAAVAGAVGIATVVVVVGARTVARRGVATR